MTDEPNKPTDQPRDDAEQDAGPPQVAQADAPPAVAETAGDAAPSEAAGPEAGLPEVTGPQPQPESTPSAAGQEPAQPAEGGSEEPAETPPLLAEPPAEAAVEAEVEPPAEAAAEAEAEPPVEAAAEAEVEPPVEAAAEAEVEPPVEAAAEAEVEPPVEAAAEPEAKPAAEEQDKRRKKAAKRPVAKTKAAEKPEEADKPQEPKSENMDWYILKVQSNREDSIREGLERRVAIAGLERYFGEVIVPTEKVTEFKGGKKRVIKRKLYPGYLVVEMEITDDTWFLVRETPGIGDFTGAAGHPTPMLPHEVSRILAKKEEKTDEAPKLKINFSAGDRVKITEGTFENFEGEVSAIDETNGRVTVMINIFGRSTPVELEYWQIEGV